MRKISSWAKANPWLARVVIILLHFILIAAAIYIGRNLTDLAISISPAVNGLAMMIYIATVFLYPASKEKRSRRVSRYTYQKSCDFMLTFTGLFMICFLANRPANESIQLNHLKGAHFESYNVRLPQVSNHSVEKKSLYQIISRKERRALLKELRFELKKGLKAEPSRGGKVVLTVLVCLGGLALLMLVGGLSCNLSCSGNEGGAVLVLLLGSAAVITLMVVLIRRINERYGKRRSRHDTWEPR